MPDSYWPKKDDYKETKIYQNHTSDSEKENSQVLEKMETSDAVRLVGLNKTAEK